MKAGASKTAPNAQSPLPRHRARPGCATLTSSAGGERCRSSPPKGVPFARRSGVPIQCCLTANRGAVINALNPSRYVVCGRRAGRGARRRGAASSQSMMRATWPPIRSRCTVTLPNRARNKSAGMLGSRRSDDIAPRLHRRGPEGSVRFCGGEMALDVESFGLNPDS